MKNIFLVAVATAMVSAPAVAHEGPYVGVIGGYDSVGADVEDDNGSKDGVMYGVIAGYDKHLGSNVMLGLEAEFADSATKLWVDEEGYGSMRASRDIYAGARLGFHVAEDTMLYAKAGYTNAQVKIVVNEGDFHLRVSDNLDGYRVGAGVEHTYSNFGVRVEYRYSDYGTNVLFGEDTTTLDRHQVVVGVTSKF